MKQDAYVLSHGTDNTFYFIQVVKSDGSYWFPTGGRVNEIRTYKTINGAKRYIERNGWNYKER